MSLHRHIRKYSDSSHRVEFKALQRLELCPWELDWRGECEQRKIQMTNEGEGHLC